MGLCCSEQACLTFGYIWTHKEAFGYVVKILCNPLCAGVHSALSLILSQSSGAHSLSALYIDPALVEVYEVV